jgi:hypothetical protein
MANRPNGYRRALIKYQDFFLEEYNNSLPMLLCFGNSHNSEPLVFERPMFIILAWSEMVSVLGSINTYFSGCVQVLCQVIYIVAKLRYLKC